jgi:3-oxoacyl-[acyl-carrier protein] reductase
MLSKKWKKIRKQMINLTGKKAILTGATGGIGRAILNTLVNAGATVVASGTREQVLEETCEPFGNQVMPIICNLQDHDDIKNLVKKAQDMLQNIDILICNAGITRDNLGMLMKKEEWNDVLDVNLTSTFLLNQLVLKTMLRNKYGRVINISSIIAYTGNAGQANYAASKAGMIGFSKSLAAEFATRNITVNCIAPGFIESPMTEKLSDEMCEQIKKKIPMQRIGIPEEVAHCALFLASEQSSYITGHTLHVNGGMFMA